MKERILEFLRIENKSSAQLAEEIGVQPSGISHIISGRNNPSLDFILKMLDKYRFLSSDWLLFGKGSMYKEQHSATLFDVPGPGFNAPGDSSEKIPAVERDTPVTQKPEQPVKEDIINALESSSARKVLLFFDDGTFEEYLRRN
jgi:transcriptional regulator with XRE-family HTH domain